ncbi:MAG: TetR/AcrR family transcriptional regulator [Candidatus Thorarchaeota archaeon]
MSRQDRIDSTKQKRLERERLLRRNAIIDVAEDFFIRQGYEHTMVDKIALEAGYTKATIYNYFDSKDDLYMAVASRAFEHMHRIMKGILSRPETTYELRSLGDAYLAFVDQYPDHAVIMDSGQLSVAFNVIVRKENAKQPLTESETELRQHQMAIEKLMIDVVTQTMENSGVQRKADPFAVVYALSTLGLAIRELVMRGKTGDQPEEQTREYLSVLFNIIDQGLKHYDAE